MVIAAIGRTDIHVDVVVGASNKQREEVEQFCWQHEYMKYHCQVSNMAELMHKADLAIGAGGSTIWERCFLDLPAIVIAVAENQVKTCEDCSSLGLFEYMGMQTSVSIEQLSQKVYELINSAGVRLRLQKACNQLYKGDFIWKIIN